MDRAFKVNSIEDFVRLVGQQSAVVKKKMGEIILCSPSSYFGPRQYCLKGKRLYERPPKNIWPNVPQPRSCHSLDSVYLANELGRPFHKILALPLDSPYSKEKFRPVLYIEYLSPALENVFCDEKREILKFAFSRVLLEEHWKSGCDLWQNTFDSLNEPLVILDDQREPVRCNTHFQNIYKKNKKLLKKDSVFIEIDGQNYEKQSYSILNEQKNYTIEHFVNCTSHLLLREKITQQKRMSALGQIADDAAHLLNNPLTGIRSMAQILIQNCKDAQNRENFLEVEKAVHRCQKIIKNFIRFSKQDCFDSTCDLNKVIHQTIPFLKTLIRSKKLVLKLESKSFLVKAEPCLLQQVIFNLVKNALEAVDDDKGIVVIQNHVHSHQIGMSVTDNGRGIPEKYCQKLFDPFFTTKKNGTGLGLRMSRQLIQKFGGDLTFNSTLHQGSCFTFYLPLADSVE